MDGTIARIKSAFGLNHASFASSDPGPFIKKTFEENDHRFHLVTNDSDEIVRQLILSKEPFADLKVSPRSLEEAIALYHARQTRNAGQEE